MAEHPDLSVKLFGLAGTRPGPGLLDRIARADATESQDLLLCMMKRREGKRSIDGIDGAELLLRARALSLMTTFGFHCEAPGIVGQAMRPLLSLEPRAGMHEDALPNLWDSIASSSRPSQASASPTLAARANHPTHTAQQHPAH